MAFIPSKYQQTIYNFIQDGTGNAVIDAVAGSGKSTPIVNALKLIPDNQSVLFLAFNKALKAEHDRRMEGKKTILVPHPPPTEVLD